MRRVFQRYGRSYHLHIDSVDDLASIADLDEALWVASGAPLGTIRMDPVFLDLLDSDDNQRIMCFELRQAVAWLLEVSADVEAIRRGTERLRPGRVKADNEDGRRILEAVGKVAARFSLPKDAPLTLEQVRAAKAEAASVSVSEAGVVLEDAAPNEALRTFLRDVLAATGGAAHPSGARGVDETALETFLRDASTFTAWHRRRSTEQAAILPIGEETDAAYDVLEELRVKIDQYFALGSVMLLDVRIAERLRTTENELSQLDLNDPATFQTLMSRAPLAPPAPEAPLTLSDSVNPYYRLPLERFFRVVAAPVLGDGTQSLTAEEWERVKATFEEHRAWRAARPQTGMSVVDVPTLERYLAGSFGQEVRGLIDRATDTALVLDNIRLAEKLILYQAHLMLFANNFVSFPHLYRRDARALFEMGTLIMDGRHFDLAVRVPDRARHKAVAATSRMFVLYVHLYARDGGVATEVAVPVTSGGIKNLARGKRGIFHDVGGAEFDAEVVDIIENPISIGEAIWAPFKRLAALVTTKVESLTQEAEAELDGSATRAVTAVYHGRPEAATAPPAPPGVFAGAGILAGGGVAIAAVGSALAYFVQTITSIPWWQALVGLATAVAAVALPAAIVAFVKLRKRDLSAILEGSGWAINARMRLTHAQSLFFTRAPRLPLGSRRLGRRSWLVVLVAVILALASAGALWLVLRSGA
jgi:hypothetical protein